MPHASIQSLMPILPSLGFVAVFVLIIWLRTRAGLRDKRVFAPSGRRKMHLLLLPAWLIFAGALSLNWLHHRDRSPWTLLAPCLLVLISGYEVFFRRPKPSEDRQNWVCDPGHCGHCGYDLTGNTSGICPECGTPIPRPNTPIEKPWWGAWWMQWRIDYLNDWRKTLATMVVYSVLFAALAVWFAFGRIPRKASAVVPALFSVNMIINCLRIVQYRRRAGTRSC